MNAQNINLRLIFSHRGVHGPGVVENSVHAVDASARLDVDGTELDVQIANDGTLWPTHDTRLGRNTNYRAAHNAPLFDIFKDDPYGPKNPRIRDFTYLQLNALFLRDVEGRVLEGVHFHSLEFVLTHIKYNYPMMVVILDVKSADAIRPTAELVERLSMKSNTVIKFLPIWLPPGEVAGALRGCNFVVVPYVNMLDTFVDKGFGPDKFKRVTNYLEAYTRVPGYASMEPPSKNFQVRGEVARPVGPGGFVDAYMTNNLKRGIGKFHQTNDYSLGTVDSLGHCCSLPDQFLATSKYFGKETPDQRIHADILLKASDWLTTDQPREVLALAESRGYRLRRNTLC